MSVASPVIVTVSPFVTLPTESYAVPAPPLTLTLSDVTVAVLCSVAVTVVAGRSAAGALFSAWVLVPVDVAVLGAESPDLVTRSLLTYPYSLLLTKILYHTYPEASVDSSTMSMVSPFLRLDTCEAVVLAEDLTLTLSDVTFPVVCV